jgi:hypothetical protein
MVRVPAKGLQLLKELDADPRLGHQCRLDAVRAHYRKRWVTAEPRSNSIELRTAPTTDIPEQNYRMHKQRAGGLMATLRINLEKSDFVSYNPAHANRRECAE